MSKTLVIILSETRAHELTFKNFKKNVLDELNADLCLCIGVTPDYDYNNPFYLLSKYNFLYNEPEDYGEAFDYAYSIISKKRQAYECIPNSNAMHGQHTGPTPESDSSGEYPWKFYGKNFNAQDFFALDDDEIVVHSNDFSDDSWKGLVFGLKKSSQSVKQSQDKVTTYAKPLHWREFLKVKDQFLGGIKDQVDQHSGSAGILIFFRWFLLKNLIDHNLIEKYDRFVITRSDYIYQLPHPKLEILDPSNIWIPNGEHYNGFTDRHVVLSKNTVEPYLNILNNFVLRSNEFFSQMKPKNDWNLEQVIKFNLEKNNSLHLVWHFPYIMYSVRNLNGTTRWSQGYYFSHLNYFVKYLSEYDESSRLSQEFKNSNLSIDDFYKERLLSLIFY